MKKYIPILSIFCFFFFFQAEKAHSVIAAPPVALFTVSDTNICVGESIIFTDQSTGVPTSWSWQFSGGIPSSDTVQNPTVTYDSTGAYDVTLIVSNIDGSDTSIKIGYITVNVTPVADFNIISDTVGCHPLSVSFTNLSTGANNYSWNFGDAFPIDTSSADTIVHQYTNVSGSTVLFNSCLIAQNQAGCADTLCKLISVYPDAPSITFFMDQDSGCSPLTVKFTTFTTGGVDTCLYDFGDGDTAVHCGPTHTFTSVSDTFYTVAISGINPWGCLTDTFTADIFVYPSPVITVTPPDPTICIGDTITLAASGVSTYNWTPAAGLSADTGATVFASPDTTITYTAIGTGINGCVDSIAVVVTVDNITAVIGYVPDTIDLDTSGTVTFTDNTIGAISWYWDFGDSSGTSTNQNPAYTYTSFGTFIVQLIVSNAACSDTAYKTVEVINTTGIVIYPDNNLKIYPSPASDMLNIETKGLFIERLILYNALGQIVLEHEPNSSSYQLNVSQFAAGMFTLKIETNKGSVFSNLIINSRF